MKLIESKEEYVPRILEIIKDAQNYLKGLQIDQWQDGYPNQEQIELDIQNEDSYVIANDSDEIMGAVVFTTKQEPTYLDIDGKWITEHLSKYGLIHRLAVGDDYRSLGIAKFVFEKCENELVKQGIKSMRIDTHRDNKGMQNLITNLGYKYCGVIILTSGAERLAFEKTFNN